MQKLRDVNEANAHIDTRTVSHTHKMWAEWIENRNQFASIRNWQSSQKLVKRTNRDKRILTPPHTQTHAENPSIKHTKMERHIRNGKQSIEGKHCVASSKWIFGEDQIQI